MNAAAEDAAEKAVMTSALADVRDAPLSELSAAETLDRLRGSTGSKGTVAVAAFNSSL
jgi:FXSXX-COOH protein